MSVMPALFTDLDLRFPLLNIANRTVHRKHFAVETYPSAEFLLELLPYLSFVNQKE